MKKRMISLLLALVMILGMVPAVAPAASAASTGFTDVVAGSFYEEPVEWAVANGITNGATATTFNPNGACLRAHVVTFLHRAAGSPAPTSTNNPFADVKSTDFFYKPVLWAVEKKITNGTSATAFGSYANCNRAQVVTFLWRANGSPEPSSNNNPFMDVKNTDFFYKAVLWAVENGITNGVDATHFGPTADCNRAQVVTFLYRCFGNLPIITKQPESIMTYTNKPVSFTVAVSGGKAPYTYQWQYIADDSSAWQNITAIWENIKNASGYTSPTFNFTADSNDFTKHYRYRCIITDAAGASVTSNEASLQQSLSIITQPKDVSGIKGDYVTISVEALGDGLQYVWYVKDPGDGSFRKETSRVSSVEFKLSSAIDGRQVYCIVSDMHGNAVKTDVVALSCYVSCSGLTNFTCKQDGEDYQVKAIFDGVGLTYQWYYKDENMSSFAKASNTTNTYSGTMSANIDGRQIYCVATDKYGKTAQSETEILWMGTPVKLIKDIPNVMYAPYMVQKSVILQAEGEGLQYQWYHKWDSDIFYNEKGKTNTFTVRFSSDSSNATVYCIVTDRYGNQVQTNTCHIMFADDLVITLQPESVAAKIGDSVSFEVKATGGFYVYEYENEYEYNYRWQVKDRNTDWENIDLNWISSAKQSTLSFNVHQDEFEKEYQYRCVVTDSCGVKVISDPVKVINPNQLTITKQPQSQTGKVGDTLSYTVEVAGGRKPYSYQWYFKAASGQWTESTVNSATYKFEVNAITVLQPYSFYCVITDADGNTIESNVATFRKG